jgi:hypothetical protein
LLLAFAIGKLAHNFGYKNHQNWPLNKITHVVFYDNEVLNNNFLKKTFNAKI